jgi:pyruvate/2-oxoglutarate dehydrogenase complex dihydrolipoamide acyltransferase (E2) component
MRTTAMLTTVAWLLGGCTFTPLVPAPPVPDAPPEQAAAPTPEPAPQPVVQARAAPRRSQTVRIDNTSIESFRASWERMRASLSPAQQADLSDAVVRLTFAGYGAANIPTNLRASPIVPEMVRDQIAGLSYAEIIALSP